MSTTISFRMLLGEVSHMKRMHNQSPLWIKGIGLWGILSLALVVQADTHNWGGLAGSWNDPANWVENDGGIPDVQDDIANITADIGAAQSISVDAPVTIGTLTIGDAAGTSGYTVTGTADNIVTFSHTSGVATISKTSGGTEFFNAPVVLASDLTFSMSGVNNGSAGTYFQFGPNGATAAQTISGTGTIINNATAGNLSFTDVIGGAIAITNNSATGVMFINTKGANSYSGDTTLNAGSYTTLGNVTGAPANSVPFGTGTLRLSGGTLFVGAAKTVANAIVAEASTTSVLRGGNGSLNRTLTLSGPITGTGTISTGTSSFVLPTGFSINSFSNSGTTAFQGDISAFQGTFTHETQLQSTATANVMTFNGITAASMDGSQATFAIAGETSGTTRSFNFGSSTVGVTTFKMGELSGTGGMINKIATATVTDLLEIGHLNTNSSFAGVIGGELLNVTKVGTGTLTLSAVQTYNGTTTVAGGVLNVDTTGSIDASPTIAVSPTASLLTNHILATTLTLDGSATIRADGGTLGASKVETLTINTGGQLNLKNNDLVVGTSTLAAVRDQIKLGIPLATNVSATAGITSDMMTVGVHGFGYALGSDVNRSPLIGGPGAGGTLSGQAYDDDSVLVKFTYRGDADLDGDSDLDDLGHWANAFTGDLGLGPLASPTTLWTQGDWDYDGDTDLDDLGFWSSTFTGDLGGGGLSVYAPNASDGAVAALAQMGINLVPEPSSICLIICGSLVLLRNKRRQG
jgi:autotransporter-associated beta strand protein